MPATCGTPSTASCFCPACGWRWAKRNETHAPARFDNFRRGGVAVLCGCVGQSQQLRLQQLEIDRLGEELDSAVLLGETPSLVVAISGYHHHRQVGPALLDLAKQRQ